MNSGSNPFPETTKQRGYSFLPKETARDFDGARDPRLTDYESAKSDALHNAQRRPLVHYTLAGLPNSDCLDLEDTIYYSSVSGGSGNAQTLIDCGKGRTIQLNCMKEWHK